MQLEINALKEAAVGRASASVPRGRDPDPPRRHITTNEHPGLHAAAIGGIPARYGVGTPATASR